MTQPLGNEHAEELGRLDATFRELSERAQEAMLVRDELVWRLMNRKVSATAIAHVLQVDRTWPYGIRDGYPERLRRWKAERKAKAGAVEPADE